MRKPNTKLLLAGFRENREKFAGSDPYRNEIWIVMTRLAQKQKLPFIVIHRYGFAWFKVTFLSNLFSEQSESRITERKKQNI